MAERRHGVFSADGAVAIAGGMLSISSEAYRQDEGTALIAAVEDGGWTDDAPIWPHALMDDVSIAGFHWDSDGAEDAGGRYVLERAYVRIPYWPFALAVMVLPARRLIVGIRSWVRARQVSRRDLCVRCGYDLRATPDHCPECGAVPVPPAPAA